MKNILIVDDSATSRMLFKAHMPEGHPHAVHEANDLPSALKMADTITPDLVVLDYNMPGANGVEVAQRLLATGLKAKLVLLTANTQQSVIEDARALGFFKVVEKPITSEKLAALLQEVGG